MGYISEIRQKIGHDRLIVVGASVIVYKDSHILLQRRVDNGMWSEHGGSVEIGETVETAAKRELFEETGLIANSLQLTGVYSGEDMLYTYPNGDMVYIIITQWLCADFSGELNPDPDEVAELKWFSIHNLPTEINPPSRKLLIEFTEKIKNPS